MKSDFINLRIEAKLDAQKRALEKKFKDTLNRKLLIQEKRIAQLEKRMLHIEGAQMNVATLVRRNVP